MKVGVQTLAAHPLPRPSRPAEALTPMNLSKQSVGGSHRRADDRRFAYGGSSLLGAIRPSETHRARMSSPLRENPHLSIEPPAMINFLSADRSTIGTAAPGVLTLPGCSIDSKNLLSCYLTHNAGTCQRWSSVKDGNIKRPAVSAQRTVREWPTNLSQR